MPSMTELKNAATAAKSAALPSLPKERPDQFVAVPMTCDAVKMALIERARAFAACLPGILGRAIRSPVSENAARNTPLGQCNKRRQLRFLRRLLTFVWIASIWLHVGSAVAQTPSMGFAQLQQPGGGKTTVFYPTGAAENAVKQGPFELSWASDARPIPGNGRLIVISHGSGGSPWVHADLGRVLVAHGFVVALPQHKGDNYLDDLNPGPVSWAMRPIEVSQAIDLLANQSQFSDLLLLDAVGVFGGSAGGHTALSFAGGEWSASRFRDYCEKNIEQDFSSCVGFVTLLDGSWFDGVKVWVAKRIISWRFSDDTVQSHFDPRVKAAVAMVPFAADFVPQSLAEPRVALGLIVAQKDVNQIPRFHVGAIRKVCEPRCEIIMDMADAGHGAMLSPMPPLEPGSVASHLLSDPAAFDRAGTLPRLNEKIADFFIRKLLAR